MSWLKANSCKTRSAFTSSALSQARSQLWRGGCLVWPQGLGVCRWCGSIGLFQPWLSVCWSCWDESAPLKAGSRCWDVGWRLRIVRKYIKLLSESHWTLCEQVTSEPRGRMTSCEFLKSHSLLSSARLAQLYSWPCTLFFCPLHLVLYPPSVFPKETGVAE